MKKRLLWRLISLVVALAIFAIIELTGNGGSNPEKLSRTLAQGELDITFKGTVTQKYLDVLSEKRSAETIKETHRQDILGEIKYFFNYFRFDDEIRKQKEPELIEAFNRIYANANYKVVKSEKKDNVIKVSVELQPLNTMIEFEEEFNKILTEMNNDYKSGKLKGTETELNKKLTNKSLEKFFEISKKPINLQDSRTITLTVNKLKTGHYQVDSKSLTNVISEVVPYKSK
ncbi:hypothetical protein HMPREF0379_0850 [[Eubacterium] yurii subsp. margaretiae ATCC 43715]|nr:hypothetical protein HMPREF0379_0850 [[Eubacterium] yurii subsp. margaretiae ATCC 43715]